jgi:hypothetical protein
MPNREIYHIGTTECIHFPEEGIFKVPAKIDTGAYNSAIWASNIKEEDGVLSFTLFSEKSPFYNSRVITTKEFARSRVRSSFGHTQRRYRVELKVHIGTETFKAYFTLANRSRNSYPVLLGRKFLRGRFVVDVTKKNLHRAKLQVKPC